MTVKTREECFEIITDVLNELLEDMGEEPAEIELTTMLNAHLGITSIDAIHMMVMLEDELDQPLSFQELAVRDNEYVEDISVGELLQFIGDSLELAPLNGRLPAANQE
ncbi:MAG: phosphopantetheine-binding protein [Candidatus Promineifilaceae bacterium]|nr:phosphopantetheine-binding protein [Candidatus Promineifilaceae bacterium]